MLYIDGFGAARFCIQGAGKVWNPGFALPAGPVIPGIVSAIGGGLLRDMLAGRTTLLMRPELYAVPMCLGCLAHIFVLGFWPRFRIVGSIAFIAGTFALPAAAVHWDLRIPAWASLIRDIE